MPMPNLLDVQLRSYEKLIDFDTEPEEQWDFALDRVFGEIFPISDVNENFTLEYVSSSLGEPKYSVEECIERDMTYAAPLKATLRLVVWEDLDDEERRPKDIIEKEVYLGDLPLLTELGTFIINGAERVVVSQLHRSPGVVFEESIHPNGTHLNSARIIPFRGSWVEFTLDIRDVCHVHIDKKKKFPATALLRALGYGTDEEIYQIFFDVGEIALDEEDKGGEPQLLGKVLAEDVVEEESGEVVADKCTEIDEDLLGRLERAGRKKVKVYVSTAEDARDETPVVKATLAKDPTSSEEEALHSIYSLLRPGEAPNLETAREALERVFFNPKRYDLGRVGRYKINQRLKLDIPRNTTVLTKEDFVAILRYLIDLSEGRGFVDDIDHLGNRRVRTVGELIANQFSVGLSRMARLVKERMSINTDPEKINIDDLVNARTVSAVIQAFFGSSQLSQFMDQTNPLAELTHKRRLSALGPGGLTRERAGFEVRDVHYSHYGRMCPIETPEGPNIGLITSLTTYARVNDLGFVETPYRVVKKGKVTDEIEWLSANEEEEARIAQANAPLNSDGSFQNEYVLCRERGDFPLLQPEEIDYMDVAPDQMVSVAAALIPFLEHDDANRALMGSNMQRQAVPLLFTDAPLVGTGLEKKAARDSGSVILARRAGEVVHVTADEIVVDTGAVKPGKGDQPLAKLAQFDRYKLRKFWRTNQDTAINQRPLVRAGDQVEPGDVLADGPATDHGELALGRNVLVAFMPWYGHNFEDAIVISEKLVKDDDLTSIHIQELELHVRDTKRGMEEITREIPNVAEESLVDLDERGIVRIGARVDSGDILVGKITPKGETELSPEEKLLTAIFGEKAKDVKDSSLKVPPGMEGTVIDVKIFSRRIDDPLLEKEHGEQIGQLRQWERAEIQRITEARNEELYELLHLNTVALCLKRGTVEPAVDEGTKLTKDVLDELHFAKLDLSTLKVQNDEANERIRRVVDEAQRRIERVREKTEEQIDKVFQPDELPPGVVQLVKVYLAEKRKISVGDKMAGRHGNKGIIARIAPEEDMPFLPDGTPVEIVLNPLGVPSRMNVGQILETHLGWAAEILGFEAKTPVFQGATEDEIGLLLKIAGLKWAGEALDVETEFPEITLDDVNLLVQTAQELLPDDVAEHLATGNGKDPLEAGLGRPLDSYVSQTLPREARQIFDNLKKYVVEAGTELAERKEKKLKEDLPAVAALAAQKSSKDGGMDDAVAEFMVRAEIYPNGKVWLRDGRSGKKFDFPVTVGEIYMLKLSHLVDDKIHARSIGPYSLVTQQPLGGKAQFGGQRFGEMEVWALEAYGAAHTLQEILTVKSDDVSGRSKVYEAIVKGDNLPEPGIPESFNVLVKELQSLGLSVTLGHED
ncbi:MAG: DNA-directed RNA polymerase subunit beta [Gemmatimonadetes bacterium]|nr:DNA-directed RNA polymerase subunit beta [Thermoplasmata archaeon]NIW37035.1 DNA-directed RNA polymerase subunit beta [Gemmatimonadota bacterium]NIW64615.1 DNA-directed RNA polymerase subunit beta [Gemmatimonadota bacterium]